VSDTNENEGLFSQYESIQKRLPAVTFTIYNMQNRNGYSDIKHIMAFQHALLTFRIVSKLSIMSLTF
jgi:hypothetical protein